MSERSVLFACISATDMRTMVELSYELTTEISLIHINIDPIRKIDGQTTCMLQKWQRLSMSYHVRALIVETWSLYIMRMRPVTIRICTFCLTCAARDTSVNGVEEV